MIIEMLHFDDNLKNQFKKGVIRKFEHDNQDNELPEKIRLSIDRAMAHIEKVGKPKAG
ncbi:MAG: hypothetical protein KJ737_10180 [Proteobacteria bacterium]|nr:hypothetical protein [Pseudomonadota bacterium]